MLSRGLINCRARKARLERVVLIRGQYFKGTDKGLSLAIFCSGLDPLWSPSIVQEKYFGSHSQLLTK